MKSDQAMLLAPIAPGVLDDTPDAEGLRFLRGLAMSGSNPRKWRDSLLARYPMPSRAQDEVVLESVLFRVDSYRHSIETARQKLREWFARPSPISYAISERGWVAILEYLSGLSSLDRSALEIQSSGGLFGSLHACRVLLALARIGVSFPLPGTVPRDSLFGWMAVSETDLRENCAGLFRKCALEMPRECIPESVDPVTWAGEILQAMSNLMQEQNPQAAWSWMESEFRLSSLLAPIDAWIAKAVASEAGMIQDVVPVLVEAYQRRSEIRGSEQKKNALLLDIASNAGFPSAPRVLAVAHRILEIQVPEDKLSEPRFLGGGGAGR